MFKDISQLKDHFILCGAGRVGLRIVDELAKKGVDFVVIERDEEVANLIRLNCDRFEVKNVQIVTGSAPECLKQIATVPHRVCIEGGRSIKPILQQVWTYLPITGRIVVTAASLEALYEVSESFTQLQARNVEVVQAAVNRLETRGNSRRLAAVDPLFILSAEKLE